MGAIDFTGQADGSVVFIEFLAVAGRRATASADGPSAASRSSFRLSASVRRAITPIGVLLHRFRREAPCTGLHRPPETKTVGMF